MIRLQDLPLSGKKVLMRVDFNVPLTSESKIADDSRIQRSLPSIQYILKEKASLILMSHLGRPKGKNLAFSLSPCAERLSSLLGKPVKMANDCIGEETQKQAHALLPGEILLLENLRFYPAEEKPTLDLSFAKQLASLGDFYVDDAFGAAHRTHSSITTITQYFPKKAAAGLLLQQEIKFLHPLIENPTRPFFAIIGGSKISSKLPVLKALLNTVDALFIGGAMAHTFLQAQGIAIGDSLSEENQIDAAKQFLEECSLKKVSLFLPEDLTIAQTIEETATTQTILSSQGVPSEWKGVDIGPMTIQKWTAALQTGKTIFWNGPLGIAEYSPFAQGTTKIAQKLSTLKEAVTIVGGGDSLAAIAKLGLQEAFSHLSTGGGASLEYLENQGHLPGIDCLISLQDKPVLH